MKRINIGLFGYGSQGRRIAEGLSLQPDMQLVGVCLKEPDLSAHMAFRKDLPIYAVSSQDAGRFNDSQIKVRGLVQDILSRLDVVVDATPSGQGEKNKEMVYAPHGLKVVFQAGEPLDIADVPVFVSHTRHERLKGASFVRIPSPQTVALLRAAQPLRANFGIRNIACTLVMPGAEPMHGHLGPVDTIIPEKLGTLRLLEEEIRSVIPEKVVLFSFTVPSSLLGTASMAIQLDSNASRRDIVESLQEAPRAMLVSSDKGLSSTDAIFEYVRRVRRSSGDIYEVCIWHESVGVTDRMVRLDLAFDPHSVQTPEAIDAARVLGGKETLEESFRETNTSLGTLSGIHP